MIKIGDQVRWDLEDPTTGEPTGEFGFGKVDGLVQYESEIVAIVDLHGETYAKFVAMAREFPGDYEISVKHLELVK